MEQNLKLLWSDQIDSSLVKEMILSVDTLSQSYLNDLYDFSHTQDALHMLTLLWTSMLSESAQSITQLFDKHQIEFYNMIHPEFKPSCPLSTLVQFVLTPGCAGVFLKQGTQMEGMSEEGELLSLLLQEDIFVSPVQVHDIFFQQGKTGHLIYLEHPHSFYAFDFQQEFLDKHIVRFHFPYLFENEPPKQWKLYFEYLNQPSDIIDQLVLPCMQWKLVSNGAEICDLRVHKSETYIQVSYDDIDYEKIKVRNEDIMIQISCLDIQQIHETAFDHISVSCHEAYHSPTYIFVGEVLEEPDFFAPFTNTLEISSCCYIAISEVFCKKDAMISLQFQLIFEEHVLNPYEDIRKEYHAIMRTLPPEPKEMIDVYADVVIFEYFDGEDWTMIQELKDMRYLFRHTEQFQCEFSFCCPQQFSPVLVEGIEDYWIRLRLLKCESRYQFPCCLHVPFIKNLQAQYTYPQGKLKLDTLYREEELHHEDLMLSYKQQLPIVLFHEFHQENDCMYLFFKEPIFGSPFSLYIQCDIQKNQNVEWKFLMSSLQGFQKVIVEDETEGFSHSGLIHFYLNKEMSAMLLFEKYGYWIKIERVAKNQYSQFIAMKDIQCNVATLKEGQYNELSGTIQDFTQDLEIVLPAFQLLDIHVFLRKENNEWIDIIDEWQDSQFYHITQEKIWIDKSVLAQIGVNQYRIHFLQYHKVQQSMQRETEIFMAQTVPEISQCLSLVHSYGAVSQEMQSQAIERLSSYIGYHNGLVSPSQFHQFVQSEFPQIHDFKMIEFQDEFGHVIPHQYTITYLVKDFLFGIQSFYEIKKALKKMIFQQTLFHAYDSNIKIVEPVYVKMSLSLKVKIYEEDILTIQKRLEAEFQNYFHPIEGRHHMGWKIGEFPRIVDIIEVVKNINEKYVIEDCHVSGQYVYQNKMMTKSTENLLKMQLAVMIGGESSIRVVRGGLKENVRYNSSRSK